MNKPKAKTKLELYQEKRKEADESTEYLRQVEVPESQGGGSKFVTDVIKEEEKEKSETTATQENYLQGKGLITYLSSLADFARQQIYRENFPVEWEYYVLPTMGERINIFGRGFQTHEGILFIIRSPKGNVYIRGVGVTREPEIDIKNMGTMIVQVENTIDSEKGILLSDNNDTSSTLKKTESGIWLPN